MWDQCCMYVLYPSINRSLNLGASLNVFSGTSDEIDDTAQQTENKPLKIFLTSFDLI